MIVLGEECYNIVLYLWKKKHALNHITVEGIKKIYYKVYLLAHKTYKQYNLSGN